MRYLVEGQTQLNSTTNVNQTSLYPYVQKYCDYLIGLPKLITENFQSIENYYGIVKCRILPHKDSEKSIKSGGFFLLHTLTCFSNLSKRHLNELNQNIYFLL